MTRKDKDVTPSVTEKLQSLGYRVADWDDSQTNQKLTTEIKHILSTASKQNNGQSGYPDRIYINKKEKLLILVEEKPDIRDHDRDSINKGAIKGIKWYLSRFNSNLFKNWKILGIAVSGDLSQEYQHKFNCYSIDFSSKKIIDLSQVTNFLSEESFLSLFNSLDEEQAVLAISSSSKKINNLLRSIDSQKRPVLLSALMICLHKPSSNNYQNDFSNHYKDYDSGTLITNILATVERILKAEGVPSEKLETLKTELAFLTTDQTLNRSGIFKSILIELENSVIPLFNSRFATNSNYDIIGKFYEEFLKYAGVSNVKRGIVLTPRHITALFTKLVDLKDNDRIVDLCCGTGAFLIAGMNSLIDKINKSGRADKENAIANVKTKQLLGFDNNSTMYICAVSNMLFRGDGKSSIYNYDSIGDKRAQEELNNFQPTIGFINPPYGGKENDGDPTPKEITFLIKLLNSCSRYGVIIAPISVFFKDGEVRNNILNRHTLKCIINMPSDLFQPNASTHTAVAVFETNRAFDYNNDEVVFYDLKDDGFVLSKNKGRTDVYGHWPKIEEELLNALKPTSNPDDTTLVRTKIKPNDEWTFYNYSKIDYSTLSADEFIKVIGDYVLFEAKKDLGILDSKINEMQKIEAVGNYFSGNQGIHITTVNKKYNKNVDITNWKDFKLNNNLFRMSAGKYINEKDYQNGDVPYVSASETDNGIMTNIDLEPMYNGNCLTIGKVGMSIYYQKEPFCATSDVTVLEPIVPDKFNEFVALFIIGVLSKQKYQWNYGNQIRLNDSQKLKIILPVDKNEQPDWSYMENYIKSLPYGDLIQKSI